MTTHQSNKYDLQGVRYSKDIEKVIQAIQYKIIECLKETERAREKNRPYSDWRAEALGYKTSNECCKRVREELLRGSEYEVTDFDNAWKPDGRVCDSHYIGGGCNRKAITRYVDGCGYWIYACESCARGLF